MTVSNEYFEDCATVAALLDDGKEAEARDRAITILARVEVDQDYGELFNTLIRRLGLLPYIQVRTASWQDRFASEAFKVDVGAGIPATLHREQSLILRRLLTGESLAVSAPTSFGKSFIIDAFIAMKRPSIVVIIVPTIALADETRRRLQSKFGGDYRIVTTAGVELAARSILIFPAERAVGYMDVLQDIDLLVVDEFYKADINFDKDRSPALLRAILRLSPKTKQRYFLAPNIKKLESNAFTRGMEFFALDFCTVYLNIEHVYKDLKTTGQSKEDYLISLLQRIDGKTLIYAGAHSTVSAIGQSLVTGASKTTSIILAQFATWLDRHYGSNWLLPQLVRRGIGVHTGRLHRFLGQIQIHLFEQEDGLKAIVSTSSIIEGVNTQAKNVVIWNSRNGGTPLNDFTYRNIVGRGGRAFRHFVGNIYLLDRPPPPEDSTLTLEMPDDVLGGEPERIRYDGDISREQVARIIAHKEEMRSILGADSYDTAISSGRFVSTDRNLLRSIAQSVRHHEWGGIGYLNSGNPDNWGRLLHKAIGLSPAAWDGTHTTAVNFIKVLNHNWTRTIPEMVAMMGGALNIEKFFSLERAVTFRLASILADVNTMNRIIDPVADDISPFISRLSAAFLPPVVHDLEEYGLPRMIARKLQDSGFINFEDHQLTLHAALDNFRIAGIDGILQATEGLTQFDQYLMKYFLNGIQSRQITRAN